MAYPRPDLTGSLPECKVDNWITVPILTGQKIEFDDTVFSESIVVTLLGTTNKILRKGVDWTIDNDDIDYAAIGSIKAFDKNFNKELVKSITFNRPVVADFNINVAHQRLYPLYSKRALFHGTPIDVTPDTIGELYEIIDYVWRQTSPVKDIHTLPDESNPRLLEEDPHMERKENMIRDEKHAVDTSNSKNYLHPTAGSFFKHTMKIKHLESNTILNEGIDYIIIGMNAHKTRLSSITSGVFDFVLFLIPITGNVSIEYHAFGGNVTLYDMVKVEEAVNNIIAFINDSSFLTPNTIGNTPVLKALIDKVTTLEDDVRRLTNSGRPSYGDVSNGRTLLKKLESIDNKLHWWTIAELYKVDGSSDIKIADRAHFRFRTLYSNLMFDAIFAINLSNVENSFMIDSPSNLFPQLYIPFENYDNIEKIIMPQFRVIWNEDTRQTSGILLQIGLEL